MRSVGVEEDVAPDDVAVGAGKDEDDVDEDDSN